MTHAATAVTASLSTWLHVSATVENIIQRSPFTALVILLIKSSQKFSDKSFLIANCLERNVRNEDTGTEGRTSPGKRRP